MQEFSSLANHIYDAFSKSKAEKHVPYIVAIAGSVCCGKSTMARDLQVFLSQNENSPRVEVMSSDGFLYPNAILEKKGLMERKGFPESYDWLAFTQFMRNFCSGVQDVEVPVYSHALRHSSK